MLKSNAAKNLISEVEALEERLESMKLATWAFLPKDDRAATSIVRSTAGLLKGRIRAGVEYQRRIRHQWDDSIRHRTK